MTPTSPAGEWVTRLAEREDRLLAADALMPALTADITRAAQIC